MKIICPKCGSEDVNDSSRQEPNFSRLTCAKCRHTSAPEDFRVQNTRKRSGRSSRKAKLQSWAESTLNHVRETVAGNTPTNHQATARAMSHLALETAALDFWNVRSRCQSVIGSYNTQEHHRTMLALHGAVSVALALGFSGSDVELIVQAKLAREIGDDKSKKPVVYNPRKS